MVKFFSSDYGLLEALSSPLGLSFRRGLLSPTILSSRFGLSSLSIFSSRRRRDLYAAKIAMVFVILTQEGSFFSIVTNTMIVSLLNAD